MFATEIKKKLLNICKTRMTTFIKAKLKKSDDQTNIDKYKGAANATEYHIISKLIIILKLILVM